MKVVSSGWYTLGSEVEQFEGEFAAHVGTRHCIGVASGSDALELSLRAVGCGPGDEVVTAANAGMYTTLAVLRIGATPKFADVSRETFNLTASTVEPAISSTCKAVVVTHLYGRLADVENLAVLCRSRGVFMIEDCAQAAGAERGGKLAGSFGHAAAFSFYPTKNLGGVGDGGAVTTNDDEVADSVRSLRQYGWSTKYRVERPGGMNSRLDEIQAAVLRIRLPLLDGHNYRRRMIAREYAQALPARAGRLLIGSGKEYTGHLAVIVCDERQRTKDRMTDAGIATAIHYPVPDHHQPILLTRAEPVDLPVTEYAAAHVLSIPLFPELREDEVHRILKVLEAQQ